MNGPVFRSLNSPSWRIEILQFVFTDVTTRWEYHSWLQEQKECEKTVPGIHPITMWDGFSQWAGRYEWGFPDLFKLVFPVWQGDNGLLNNKTKVRSEIRFKSGVCLEMCTLSKNSGQITDTADSLWNQIWIYCNKYQQYADWKKLIEIEQKYG